MPGELQEQQNQTNETSSETQSLDTSSALADISSELFGTAAKEEEGGKATEGTEQAAPGEAKPVDAAAPSQEENAAAVQEVGAPQTWSKEAIAEWATIPERAKQEILKREEDMFRGLEEYKGRAEVGDAYTKVAEPYKPIMDKLGLNPVDLFHSFAGNHYILSFGTQEQKLALAANLLNSYQIDIIDLATHLGNMPAFDPQKQQLEIQNQQLQRQLQQRQQQDFSAARSNIQAQIAAFAGDPKNIYFNELSDDIAKLIESGVCNTLAEAYDKAVYANPVTRQKELDRLTAERKAAEEAEANARREKNAASTAADVRTRPNSRDGTVPLGSMDETMEETLAAIRARG